jgi:ZIP family zinc transporter
MLPLDLGDEYEIIPETHRGGYEDVATFSLLAGFVLMMLLDATFA